MYAVIAALNRRWPHGGRRSSSAAAGGEPVDLRRTIASHGVADLPPNRIDEEAGSLELTLPVDRPGATTIRISAGRKGHAEVEVIGGRAPDARIRAAAAHVLRLDEDLSPFYGAAKADPELAWAAQAPDG